ncbi:MAG: antitoxin [Alphaproteobacteria bacterium]|nr:MAG: hypothetical protein B6I23_02390 [Rickettsiaceae bacterium 4572_127]
MNDVAKVFMNGMSQAIRLPKQFRFNTKEVFITKEKNKVILSPKKPTKKSWEDFFQSDEKFPNFDLKRDRTSPQKRDLF